MICANCGGNTSKRVEVEAGVEYSSFICDNCNFIQGKIPITPKTSVTSKVNDKFNAHIKKPGFVARILTKPFSKLYDHYTPESWRRQQHIIPKVETPPSSGMGYIFSPYTSLWGKMWGITPIADLAKYRLMYRTVPKIKRGIDKTVSSAIIKGFNGFEITEDFNIPEDYELFYNKEEFKELVIEYVDEWVKSQSDFSLNISMIASDMLVYGNAYVELVYEELTEEEFYDDGLQHYEVPNPNYGAGQNLIESMNVNPTEIIKNPDGKYKQVSPKGKLVWLKPLDPLYMRVRSDAYGNVYGYLQFLSAPPIAYTPDKMAHFRYSPKSWQYEILNGTSMLMSLIRTQDIIWQIENDLILLGHATVKPPVIFSCGTIEEPWTKKMFNDFITSSSQRGPGGDVYVRGDVKAVPLPAPTESIQHMVNYLDYHDTQRTIALGVPPQLLGQPEGSSRTTAEVSFNDWINILELVQKEISDTLEDQVFRRVVELEFGEGAPIPRPIWNKLFEKNETDIVSRIISMKQAGIITVNEARKWLAELNIKIDDIKGGDTIPEVEMGILQTEEMQKNLEAPIEVPKEEPVEEVSE